MRGQAVARLGDEDAAAAEFANAIEAAPRDKDVWTDVARFRRANGDLAGAIVAADKAVSFDAKDVAALTLRGELTRSQYGLRAALPWFDRPLEINPDNVPAPLELAATLGHPGQVRAGLAGTGKGPEKSQK